MHPLQASLFQLPAAHGTAPAAAAPSGASATRPAGLPAAPADPGDALGFDHARYGLVPPADCLWPGHPVREGWERGRHRLARRERPATPAVRQWLALRLSAWRAGLPFDDHQITPGTLRALATATHCPISGARLADDAPVVRLDESRGWTAGHLVRVAPAAAERLAGLDWAAACAALAAVDAVVQRGESGGNSPSRAFWRRLVALKSLATPLSHDEALAQPLHVLPPNRLRLVNPVQALQALLTLQLAAPGWGQRAAGVAEAVPDALRGEFNLFFHTLLARAMQQGHGPARDAMRGALEQAWGHAAVQRRWEAFARRLTPAAAEVLVGRVAARPLPGLAVLRHDEGLALAV